MLNIAILDDYPGVALASADWSRLPRGAKVTVFDRHLSEEEAAVALQPFDVLCTMRERMAFPRSLLSRLPNLKLITIVGWVLPNMDVAAATEQGILVTHSGFGAAEFEKAIHATAELTWGLAIASMRRMVHDDRRMRAGGWQGVMGKPLHGRTLGLLGLGRIGRQVAQYGKAFGMNVIAWSQNLTAEAAEASGARRVDKDALFQQSDVLSIHVILSGRTRGLVGARELGLMPRGSFLVNTSRGPIVEEAALINALNDGHLGGAGLDVFDHEPLPGDHPFRRMDSVTMTPHIGYCSDETFRIFYGDMLEAILAYGRGEPIRVANPEVLPRRAAVS